MPSKNPRYNQKPAQALKSLRLELKKMQAETDREQLKGIDPDKAFEMGYAAAIKDFDVCTGPDPRDVIGVIEGQMTLPI